MVRLKPAHATTNGRRQPCWSLTLTRMSSPQPAGQTEDSGEVERGEGLESRVICQITSTNLKSLHRVTVRRQMAICVTHTHANTHSQAPTLQNPSNRDDSRSLQSQGSNKHSRHTSYVCHAGGW